MSKIGTITFHWATNYGAVLQAYALQQFLIQNKFRTEIINYVPLENLLLSRIDWVRKLNFNSFARELKIKEFRKQNLIISKNKYKSSLDLKKCKDYHCIIAGSDQIFNFSFVKFSERKRENWSYYLDFANLGTDKIAYAASFGSECIPEQFKEKVKLLFGRFHWVSVRENTAKKMLSNINIQSDVVLDPTMLLKNTDYNKFLGEKSEKKYSVFPYILHDKADEYKKITNYIASKSNLNICSKTNLSVEEWLRSIRDSELVLTNSFHGVVFSILFHTPFIIIPTNIGGESINMNDRLNTLLNHIELNRRMLFNLSTENIQILLSEKIDWEFVDKKVDELRTVSRNLLLSMLSKNN